MNYIVVGFVDAALLMHPVGYFFDPKSVREGLRISLKTWIDPEVGLISLVVSATLIASLVQATIPR